MEESEFTKMEEEKPNHVWNEEKWLVDEDELIKVVKEEEKGELPIEITENGLEKEQLKNEFLNNCINPIMSEVCEIQVKEQSVFDDNEEINVKIESEVLEDDLKPGKLTMFICQPDLDIKEDSESDKMEMFEVITSMIDPLQQSKSITESVEEKEVQMVNKEPQNVSGEVEKQNKQAMKVLPQKKENISVSNIIKRLREKLTGISTSQDFFEHDSPINIPKTLGLSLKSGSKKPVDIKEDQEEALKSKKKLPVIASVQSLVPKTKQLVLRSEDHSKCTSVIGQTLKKTIVDTAFSKPNKPLYNCKEDGFLNCPFKTLHFNVYLKHVEAIHQVDVLRSFSSEHKPQREVVMKGWLEKKLGPFQCRYCKKVMVTHQDMKRHQGLFHPQKRCWFYYRKFVPNNTVMNPEQVNLEDPSFTNHVTHLSNQANPCGFKLTNGTLSSTSASPLRSQPPSRIIEIDLDQSKVSSDKPEISSMSDNKEVGLLDESDPLYLHNKLLKDDSTRVNPTLAVEVTDETLHKSAGKKCKWKGCCQTYDSQMALVKHIEKIHVETLKRGDKFTCFWINCPKKSKPFSTRFNLLTHARAHGKEIKPKKCPFQSCSKAFPTLRALKIHERTHTGEKPYLCPISNCFKSFTTSSGRDVHQRTHYNIKPYACQVTGCSKSYTSLHNLRIHVKHHKVDDQLNNKSSNSSDNAKHQKIPYDIVLQCNWKDCDRKYASQTALVEHIEKNHLELIQGEKYTCHWIDCPKKSKLFRTRFNLLLHMKAHSREKKTHKCPFQGCNKTFLRLDNLKVHQKSSHTGEKP